MYYGDAGRPDLLESAGAGNAKLLVIAIDDKNKSIQLAKHVSVKYPKLKILARAADTIHLFSFYKENLMSVQRETFDSAICLGEKALVEPGFKNYQAHRAARTFKNHDENILDDLYLHRIDDEKKIIKETRKFTEQLEDILATENEQSIHESENAWDVTTLREEIKQLYSETNKQKR